MKHTFQNLRAAQDTKEAAQHSLQQLKAEIAALIPRVKAVGGFGEKVDDIVSLIAKMRQLSAV